jgi:hypothetical protein
MGWVEAGAMVVTLGACASGPPAITKGAPEGVDYLMAVQCAGLAEALATFTPNASGYTGGYRALANAYGAWANQRAAATGGTWAAVSQDIEASRRDFIDEAGRGMNAERIEQLMYLHRSSYNVCDTLAGLPEYIVIGG